MNTPLKPLGDTIRSVSWEELPASVREIPENFDPLAEGVLMKHQREWVSIKAKIKLCAKGRRTGITFAEALEKSIRAASRKEAGGSNVFYIPDAKEKGLEFIGYCARFLRNIAEAQSMGISSIEEFIFDDQKENGETRKITAWRIRLASGFQIVALSSRPASLRGLQGIVIIDEAAFHQDVQAVLDAATALLIWGGELVLISSHNTKKNPFYQMQEDILAGRYGENAVVMIITFDDAVANGLYERVCMMNGEVATEEGKKTWYNDIRKAYGPRVGAMREELDAIPRDGSGSRLPAIWIDQAMPEVRPVFRLTLSDDFTNMPEPDRRAYVQDWLDKEVLPELEKLDKNLRHVAGHDFARHRDFSHLTPAEIDQNLNRNVPFVIEMHKVPTRQQEQIIWFVFRRLPNFSGASMDATGSGETIAEYTADELGHDLIHQIKINRAWYGQWMTKYIQAFEDGVLTLPRDANLEADHRAIEEYDGIPMVNKARSQDLKEPDLFRHGDGASSGCLMWHASLNMPSIDTHILSKGSRTASKLLRGYRSGQLTRGFR
ncbi:phage protein [Acinetobacter bereziniae]|uniref:phage protein n=1 Tax=Acinetobacter bereziniae TaxID=106648 RepID=UPI000665C483|nr:phage protein [Acinetobacter bereziniae]